MATQVMPNDCFLLSFYGWLFSLLSFFSRLVLMGVFWVMSFEYSYQALHLTQSHVHAKYAGIYTSSFCWL
jgi:hypothetical protein